MQGVYFDCPIPKFCANCGAEFYINKDRYNLQDYLTQASHSCKCGVKFISVYEGSDLSSTVKDELETYR